MPIHVSLLYTVFFSNYKFIFSLSFFPFFLVKWFMILYLLVRYNNAIGSRNIHLPAAGVFNIKASMLRL